MTTQRRMMPDYPSWESRYSITVGLLVVALSAAYVGLRYVLDSPTALVLSQMLYVAAPAAAAVTAFVNARHAQVSTRSKAAWYLLATAMALLFVSEAAYSWYTVHNGLPSDPVGGTGDVASALATVAFLGLVASASPRRVGDTHRTQRILIDLLAVGTLAFVLAFRYWVVGMLGKASSGEVLEAARLSLYGAVGVVVITGALFALGRIGSPTTSLWLRLMRMGIAIYGMAVVAFPIWSLSIKGAAEGWAEIGTSLLFFVGYLMIGAASYARVLRPNESWVWGTVAPRADAVWGAIAFSTLTFAALLLLGWEAMWAEVGSVERSVYFAALFVATAALVGRTLLSATEVAHLRQVAERDMATGASNRRRIDDRLIELTSGSERFGEPFVVAAVELGGRVTATDGTGTDAVMQCAASALVGLTDLHSVFKLSRGSFLVTHPCGSRREADTFARRIFAVVDEIEGVRSVSVGYAVSPYDSVVADELLRMAESALGWAKYHGDHRVVAHDEDILVALNLRERHLLAGRHAELQLAQALSSAADAFDPTNYRHARNVASLAVLFARHLGMDAAEVGRIELAAMLHDVGKLAVPLSSTPRSLKSDEAASRLHTELGGYMLESLEVADLAGWVRAHHERWDGAGFPDGLAGESIPVAARIIALADAYDTSTTGTTSRRPRSRPAALQEIDLGLGTRFDPDLGERFIGFVGAKGALGWADDEWPAA